MRSESITEGDKATSMTADSSHTLGSSGTGSRASPVKEESALKHRRVFRSPARRNLEPATETARPLIKKREMMSCKLGRSLWEVKITDAKVASGRSELLNDRDADERGLEGMEQGGVARMSSSQENCNRRILRFGRNGFFEDVKPQNREHLRKQGV